jgi:hypothetical protein
MGQVPTTSIALRRLLQRSRQGRICGCQYQKLMDSQKKPARAGTGRGIAFGQRLRSPAVTAGHFVLEGRFPIAGAAF